MVPRHSTDNNLPEDEDTGEGSEFVGESASRRGIQSVEIAMRVLEALEEGAGPMSLTQIASRAGMQPSKAHRYLVSLGRIGLLTQSPASGLYDLGPAMRRLGAEALRRLDETGLVSDHLHQLRDVTGHSVNLAVWGDHGPIVVRWQYGSHPLPITVRIGATLPLMSSSVGRVYLACLPDTVTDPILAEQQAKADGGRWSTQDVAKVKREVRRDGLSITFGGVIPGVASLAAPVMTSGESLPLVIAIVLPEREATADALEEIAGVLREKTSAISAELGYRSNRSAPPAKA